MFRNFLNECDCKFKTLICPKGSDSDCQVCFEQAYYKTDAEHSDHYNCLKGCYYYAMHYGPAYISEIYHLLDKMKLLENYTDVVKIASLGGGFGTDLAAILKYRSDKLLPIHFMYSIVDNATTWQDVINILMQDTHIQIENVDVSENNIELSSFDIIFLNKVFSTLKTNNQEQTFLMHLNQSLISMKIGAFFIFNDVNNSLTGRDEFLNFMACQPNIKCKGKYYFPLDNAYTGDYEPIYATNNILDISGLNLSCEIMNSVRKTFFAIYQKEV